MNIWTPANYPVLPLCNLDYSQWNLDTARVLLHLLLLYDLQSLLIEAQEHTEVLQESPDIFLLFPLLPLHIRSIYFVNQLISRG